MTITVKPDWQLGLRLAREASWGSAPSFANYNEGGKWFSAFVTDPDGLEGMGEHIVPSGYIGRRAINQYAPTPGGTDSEGTLEFPATSDVLGLLLVGALGSVSTTLTADVGNPLKAAATIGASPATIGGITAPTTSAFLRFTVASASGGSGTIAVTGVTANGETFTENVAVSGNGTFYTRRSFTTLTSVVVTHTLTGTPTLQVDGYVKAVHDITQADSAPSISVEQRGRPEAGSGNSFIYSGMVIGELGIQYDAKDKQGLLVATAKFGGKFPVASAASILQQPVHVPMPAWAVKVTRNGSNFCEVMNLNLTLTTNAAPVRGSCGVQDPQGVVYGGLGLQGQMTIATNDATEYNAWRNRIVGDYSLICEPPFLLDATTKHKLVLDLTQVYFANFKQGKDGSVLTGTFDFYTRDDDTDGILRATLTNSVSSYA